MHLPIVAGIYLHIPFCRKACHYCDFHFSTQLNYVPRMVNAMNQELKLRSAELMAPVETIYLGGGTPSLLEEQELKLLLSTIRELYPLSGSLEVTLEANPEDLTEERLESWRLIGINRLSIGLQTFNDEELRWMNRVHDSQRSIAAVKLAQKAGFTNITVDLIYGSKFQTTNSWRQTIKSVIDLGVPHVSAYNLTIESGTALGTKVKKGIEPEIDDELSSELFMLLVEELTAVGFEQYEISNFAKPLYRSKHNSNYWKGIPYLGIGPSAHSFNGAIRRWNISNNQLYMKAVESDLNFSEEELIDDRTAFNEYIMTSLRTIEGCSLDAMRTRFGSERTAIFLNGIKRYDGYYLVSNGFVQLNQKGRLLADRIASDLFIL